MIIPSIDISRGQAVQLIGGETLAIEAGDPVPLFEKFSVAGEVAVVDIDAARGDGDNRDLIQEVVPAGQGSGRRWDQGPRYRHRLARRRGGANHHRHCRRPGSPGCAYPPTG